MATKRSNLSPEFMAAAARDPLGALATQFLAAFGIDLDTLMSVAEKAIHSNDDHVFYLAIAAAVQIRANVVFVGRDFGNVREKYPELVIEGDRPQNDIYNYGALHALGHIFCHLTNHQLGQKVLNKVGSCITGAGTPDSEAGKINKEMANSWSVEDKNRFIAWSNDPSKFGIVNALFNTVAAKKAGFKLGSAPSPPVRPSSKLPPASSSTS